MRVWLVDDAVETVCLMIGQDGIVGIAAGDDAADARVDLLQALDRFLSTHAAGYG